MNYYYCQFCFKKTAQESNIVKFCAHCGKSFHEATNSNQTLPDQSIISSYVMKNQNNQKKNNNREAYKKLLIKRGISIYDEGKDNDELDNDIEIENNNDDNSNNDDNISVPSINKLQMEVDIPQDMGIPVRSLARAIKKEPRITNNKTKAIKINKKKFLEEYLKSASAIRPKK